MKDERKLPLPPFTKETAEQIIRVNGSLFGKEIFVQMILLV